MKYASLLLTALLLVVLHLWAVASTREEAAVPTEEPSSSFWDYTEGGLRSGIRAIPGVGEAAGDFLFGSQAQASLRIQKQLLKTNNSTLHQIRMMAHDALQVKKKIEELDRLRKDAIRLGKRLQRTNYLKALLGLGEDLLRVDVSPSKYVPHTEYTRTLKKSVHLDLSRDKGVVGQSSLLLKNTRKALALTTKQRHYQDYPTLVRDLRQAEAHDRALEKHLVHKKVALAQHYEQLAESLLKANQELEALLRDEEANLTTAEAVQAYQTISENTQNAALFKEKACRLYEEAAQLSATDEATLQAEANRLATQALVAQEIAWYEDH